MIFFFLIQTWIVGAHKNCLGDTVRLSDAVLRCTHNVLNKRKLKIYQNFSDKIINFYR